MAVNIDPSEVRNGTSTQPAATSRLRLPTRTILIGGLGGAGLLAFSVGAFSFFSTLADPRARTPRPMQAAASMPDLKDGMPVLVNGEPISPAPKAAVLNLPKPEPTPAISEPAAAPAPLAEPAPVPQTAASEPSAPALRAGPTPPPIQNAATLPETRTVAPVAPPARTAATIPPARTETVKAKPVQAPAAVVAHQEPVAEPTSTATAVAPASLQPARKPAAAKAPAPKTAARKTASTKTVADAEPTAAPAAASTASDESDIPGARQFRAGVKAIGGLFGGDAKDE